MTFLIVYARVRLAELRDRAERGASAVEWAVISGICVVAALAVGAAIKAVVADGIAQLPAQP